MTTSFSSIIKAHQEAVRLSFEGDGEKILQKTAELIASALKQGNKILLCGNGGSAADSQHIAAEFVGRFKKERRGLPAIALTTDTSALTCIANDYGYDVVFSRQVEALGDKGDILIALSTSGNSKNVLYAVEKAKAKGLVTIGFSGRDGGELKKITDHCFIAKSNETAHIQEVHGTALHAICEVVDTQFE
jgi:D-sedoheptulose 7-phosphate isomerase